MPEPCNRGFRASKSDPVGLSLMSGMMGGSMHMMSVQALAERRPLGSNASI
jgi:hypothetical protein